ncbi:glycosyltransferase family 2 protein [Acetobacter malorum]|uniref:glycosyltransferase n=1 Tax=Acetobacter malorum TaxID=178901 RepID=UPI0009EF3EE5|nr:glycosyltransferase [Acetobacter malorum]
MTNLDWSVVIPYFNESDCLSICLSCIVSQKLKPAHVILVNNGSFDDSINIAKNFKKKYSHIFNVVLIDELEPGKINALRAGSAFVKTKYFATWDADTFYSPFYLAVAHRVYEQVGLSVVAVMATNVKGPLLSLKSLFRIGKIQILSRIFKSECHAGGYAETFRTDAYRAIGGFDPNIWPYVLEDHEIVQRLLKVGEVRYPVGMWCVTANRRVNRDRVTWSGKEKFIYRFTPYALKDWFFYKFLASQFSMRGLNGIRLREQTWKVNSQSRNVK